MAYENSPEIEQFEDGHPNTLPSGPHPKPAGRILISALFMIVVVLGALNFLLNGQAAALAGKGSISGIVLDTDMQPLQAEVFVSGSDHMILTDAEGRFEIPNVPAGQQQVVAAYQYTGWKFPATVQAGKTTDLGQLIINSQARPYLDQE